MGNNGSNPFPAQANSTAQSQNDQFSMLPNLQALATRQNYQTAPGGGYQTQDIMSGQVGNNSFLDTLRMMAMNPSTMNMVLQNNGQGAGGPVSSNNPLLPPIQSYVPNICDYTGSEFTL
jgi:hypothetical protein